MARLLFRLGSATHRHRLLVVLLWLVVLAGTAAGAFTLAGPTSADFSIPGQESTTAQNKIKEMFGGGGATARVIVKAPGDQKITEPENVKAITDLVGTLSTLPGVASATNPLDPAAPAVNPDLNAAYSTVTYTASLGSVPTDQRTALLDTVAKAGEGGRTVEVTGEALQAPPPMGGVVEGIGVIISLAILALTYGSLVTAGMNLLTAGVGVGIGVLGITLASGFLELHATTPLLAAMLGLAVGIDYALFIINRYRHELREGADPGTAIGTTVGTAGSAVVVAGSTVIIALLGLVVTGIPFLAQMGVAAAVTIAIAVLVAITLVPAVLGYLGRRALPRGGSASGKDARERGFFRAWSNGVTRYRVPALLLSVVAMGTIAVPVLSMRSTLVEPPAEGSTQERAQRLINDEFGPGFNGPLIVLVEGAGASTVANQASAEIAPLAAFVAPAIPNGPENSAALLTVIPKSGPTDAATERLVADLRAHLGDLGGAKAYVTGATAVSVDVATALDRAMPIYLVVIVGLALLLLVLVFRSVLVPIVGVLGFLLTIGASLGATVAVFQWGWLADVVNLTTASPLISLIPIVVIGILFGLAMDYQVFLVSRMHEAYRHGDSPRDAIHTGFRQAAPVVVAAALIMFFVFAGFVPTGEGTIKPIAFALAIGVLADAFVVRMVLVPAALAMLGRAAWWLPRWLRWLPTVDVEGTGLSTQFRTDGAGGGWGSGRAPSDRRPSKMIAR
jgi:RND superfamily putative drug exporter